MTKESLASADSTVMSFPGTIPILASPWMDNEFKEKCDLGDLDRYNMVSALVSGASGPGSSPGRGHCVVFLGKILYSHSASLHPGV